MRRFKNEIYFVAGTKYKLKYDPESDWPCIDCAFFNEGYCRITDFVKLDQVYSDCRFSPDLYFAK